MSEALKPLIHAAAEGPLSPAQAAQAFEILFEGGATPSQVGGFLMACGPVVKPSLNMQRPPL